MKTSTLLLLAVGLYFLTRKSETSSGPGSTSTANSSPLNGPPTAPYLPDWDPSRSYLPGANNDPLLVYAAYGKTSIPT